MSYKERTDFMIKLLLGASPCTYWSIAKREGREVVAAGQGWELFKNFLIEKERFKPDFFLYENNQSMSNAIKEQISNELGTSPIAINSALVTAQVRKRYYWMNIPAPPPQDREIYLKDVLGVSSTGMNIGTTKRIGYLPKSDGSTCTSQAYRIYSIDGKSVNLVANGGGIGAKTGLYAIPSNAGYTVRANKMLIKGTYYDIDLADGTYEIRKLTPLECERLQTLPDNYTYGISDS